MIELVVGPDDPEAARWAASLDLPAGGRLAAVVPGRTASIGALVGEVLAALGITASANPHWRTAADSLALGAAWLRARRIDRLVLVHADWLAPSLVPQLGAFAALAGTDVACLVLPSGVARFRGWASGERGWLDFAAAETRDEPRRLAVAGDPARNLRAPIGPLGAPDGTVRVEPAPELDGEARAAFIDLAGRLRREGRVAGVVARSLALVLRTYPAGPSRAAAVAGAAVALERAGYALWTDGGRWPMSGPAALPAAGPVWADLADSLYPHGPAAVALLASGLWATECAAVTVDDVAPDGSAIRSGGRTVDVAPGARAFLVAQRLLRTGDGASPTEPLLVHRRRALTPRGIAGTASALLRDAGLDVRPAALLGHRSPSVRWLAGQGLVLRAMALPDDPLRMARRCRHGLPDTVAVEGVSLSHSQRLCLAPGPASEVPAEVRPSSAGYAVRTTRRSPLGTVVAVSRFGEPAGELVALETPSGQVWLQVGTGTAPSLEAIAAEIRATHPEVLGRREAS